MGLLAVLGRTALAAPPRRVIRVRSRTGSQSESDTDFRCR
jgi:hypothetical protein